MEENKIYTFLKQNNLTTKSQDEFLSEYADSAKVRQLHKFFTDNSLTSKDFDTFYKDNFTNITPSAQQTTDYGPFDENLVKTDPRTRQNFERWQQDNNGKLTENANVAPDGNGQTNNIPY